MSIPLVVFFTRSGIQAHTLHTRDNLGLSVGILRLYRSTMLSCTSWYCSVASNSANSCVPAEVSVLPCSRARCRQIVGLDRVHKQRVDYCNVKTNSSEIDIVIKRCASEQLRARSVTENYAGIFERLHQGRHAPTSTRLRTATSHPEHPVAQPGTVVKSRL